MLRQCNAQGLTYCLNPEQAAGKLYFLTDLGRAVVQAAFGQRVDPLPSEIDWREYALIARAKIRRLILQEIAMPRVHVPDGKTASELRKKLLNSKPVSLSQAVLALQQLTRYNLIRRITTTLEEPRKQYQLTEAGRRVVEELKRCGTPNR